MMFSLICLLISIILYIGYITYIYIKYKPDCISQSYYLLDNGNIFTIWIILISLFIFPIWVEISSIYFQFLPFLSIIALSLVGICPKYIKQDRIPHIAGAIMTCALSVIWNMVSNTLIIPMILLPIIALLYVSNAKNKLFWIECLAFLNIYLSIIIKVILVL